MKYVDIVIKGNGKMPFKKYDGDAGYDLYVSRECIIPPHSTVDVHTDVYMQMPIYTFARIIGRSSTVRKHGLMVNEGIIDNGYTGELFISIHNLRDEEFHVKQGVRLAQVIFQRIEDIRWCPVERMFNNPKERNEDGFGSTGE